MKEANALGVPPKAMRLAIGMWEDEDRDQFDRGYARARGALNIPMQLEMQF